MLFRSCVGLSGGQIFFGLGEILQTYPELLAFGFEFPDGVVPLAMQPANSVGLPLGFLASRLQLGPRGGQGTGKAGDLLSKAGDLLFKSGLTVDQLLQLVDHYHLISLDGHGLIFPHRPEIIEPPISDLQLGYVVNQLQTTRPTVRKPNL